VAIVAGSAPPLLILIYIALFLLPLPSLAHELGTVQVSATFRQGGSWQVDVAIDEEHIPRLDRLGTTRPAGETRYGPIAGLTPELRARLGVFLSQLADRSTLAFDGRPAAPEKIAVDRPAPPADDPFAPPPKITLHLSGAIPPGARAAAFSTTVPVGRYPLAFLNEGDAEPSRRWQKSGEAGTPFRLSPRVVPPPRGRVVLQYLGEGFRQILPLGTEPLLFLCGIFLLGRRTKPVIALGTAFTAACLLASAAAVYGGVSLPPRLAAPALALSLLGVAVEGLLPAERRLFRIALVLAGGLLYGLGFGAALRQLAPPRPVLTAAFLGFDLGIATGLLTVLAAALLLVGRPLRDQLWYRHRVVIPAALALATLGLYWSVERIFLS
jgi:hypothetical protein